VSHGIQPVSAGTKDSVLSLYRLLDPEVLANPYPLFQTLREEDPVHWDPFLHAWVVTRYVEVMEVLHTFSADRTPTPEQLATMGLDHLGPIAQLMVKQMLFMDASAHTRLRGLASVAFTPARVNALKSHIEEIVNALLDEVQDKGQMDVITDLAEPLPAIVTAEMLGVPVSDRHQLKQWSANFAEMLGNFQHNPERAQLMLRTVDEMTQYFRDAVREIKKHPREGLIHSLLTAEIDGDNLAEEEVVANTIVTMVGGQETTTNLIGNGVLTLLRNPEQMERLKSDLSLIPSAVEEMLRYESPSQHTARLAPSDCVLGGKHIGKRQAVIAVMAAANRDPEKFPDPDRFDIERKDNRHLAFGYAAHFCFGAPLARAEGQIVFETLLRRMPKLRLEPQTLVWRTNLGLRGLTSLKVRFDEEGTKLRGASAEEPVSNSVRKPQTQERRLVSPSKLSGNAELNRMLAEWNNTRSEYPSDKCVHQLVEERAEREPNATAAEHDGRRLTYRELTERANQLSHYLRSKGVGADVPVGVCLPRSPELFIALLGVLKAGGACLPLDPDYPKERLTYMLEDSQASVLITNSDFLPIFGSSQREIVLLNSDLRILEGRSRNNPSPVTTPDNLATLIYTSGSTGKPRGVLLTHRGLVNHNFAAIKLYGIQPADRVLQFASISFDIAIEEMWPTWIAGATLVARASKTLMGSSELLNWVREQRITVLNFPTAYWHEIVRELAESKRSMPQSVRLVIVGGEKASSAAYKSWLQCGGDRVRWINTYGPTEASVIATSYEPDRSIPIPDNLPIGRPIANTEIYILNEDLQPVPVGEPGELHIGGPGVARGYLNRPDLTASKFIVNPFKNDRNARLYKTGDSARFLPDGQIEFIGRTDFQVKIRGYRIELGEIEAILEKCPGVRECVVIAREDDGSKYLVGYVVAAVEASPSSSALKDFLAEQLPEYMVPADFVFLKSLPLTPNGKVDRRALPAPSLTQPQAREVAAPRDAVESQMVKIWQQVLGKRPIGVKDNFFELGGHSLLAVRLMGRVEKAFGQQLPLTALVQAPTIEQFATLVRRDASSELWSSLIPLQADGTEPPLFFVHGLGGTVLRFHELAQRMRPDQPFYGIQARGLNGKDACFTRVDEMANYYLAQLRGVQPEGPYFLGGYSFGGWVALEMGRRLIEAGQLVGLLALVDTYPGAPKSTSSLVGTFLTLSAEQKVAYLKKRVTRYRKGIKRRVDMLRMPRPLKNVREACAVAEQNYSPRAYPGKIVLFRASEKALRGLDDPQGGWSQYVTAGLEIREIDADHGNILNEPQVQHLAAALRAAMKQAQTTLSELPTFSIS